jgi:hypothetical protein
MRLPPDVPPIEATAPPLVTRWQWALIPAFYVTGVALGLGLGLSIGALIF